MINKKLFTSRRYLMAKQRTHKILDRPILSYFLLAIFVLIVQNIGLYADNFVSMGLTGMTYQEFRQAGVSASVSGIFQALFTFLILVLFKFWFKPDFKGCLAKDTIKTGLIMLLPVLVIHWAGSIVSIITFGMGNIFFAFLHALAPGFGEEIAYRGLGISNYMRTIKDKKKIKVIFWVSSITFGLIHLLNMTAGGDPISVLVQAVYATGIGMAFGAVFLRTGNLWPTIIAHCSLDFLEFIRADLTASGGLMMGLGVGDWITIAASLVAAVIGLRLVREEYYDEIMQVWNDKWSK